MAEPRYGEERKQMGSIVGDRPKISVIMGVYNGADRVDEANSVYSCADFY